MYRMVSSLSLSLSLSVILFPFLFLSESNIHVEKIYILNINDLKITFFLFLYMQIFYWYHYSQELIIYCLFICRFAVIMKELKHLGTTGQCLGGLDGLGKAEGTLSFPSISLICRQPNEDVVHYNCITGDTVGFVRCFSSVSYMIRS